MDTSIVKLINVENIFSVDRVQDEVEQLMISLFNLGLVRTYLGLPAYTKQLSSILTKIKLNNIIENIVYFM